MSKSPGATSERSTRTSWKLFSLSTCSTKYPTPTPAQLMHSAGRPLYVAAPQRVTSEPSPRVSTSPKNGAMIFVPVVEIGKGVYVSSGSSNVTFPLLLTWSCEYDAPKKSIVNPIGTFETERSSFETIGVV